MTFGSIHREFRKIEGSKKQKISTVLVLLLLFVCVVVVVHFTTFQPNAILEVLKSTTFLCPAETKLCYNVTTKETI